MLFFTQKTQKSSKRHKKCSKNQVKISPWVDVFWFSVHRVFERPYTVFATFYWFALLQTARKTYKKHAWKITCFLHQPFKQTNWKITENDVQNAPQNVRGSPARPSWGAPGAPLAPKRLFDTKKWGHCASKVTARVQNCSKNDPKGSKWKPKGISKEAPCLQNASKFYKILGNSFQPKSSIEQQLPTMARRTARSAFNKYIITKLSLTWFAANNNT